MNRATQKEAPTAHSRPNGRGAWCADDHGAAMTEYVVVVGFVALVSIPAFTFLGYVVAHSYSFVQSYALNMFP